MPLKRYLKKLIDKIQSIQPDLETVISLDFEVETPVYFDVKDTLSCGLMINELITNSIQHQFDGNGSMGRIRVTFQNPTPGSYKLIVADNGPELPEDFDMSNLPSMGLELVERIVNDDLNGKFDITSEGGTVATVTLPYDKSSTKN